jgi:hypothetical protein
MSSETLELQMEREARFSRATVSCVLPNGKMAMASIKNVTLSGLQMVGRTPYEKGQLLTVSISTKGIHGGTDDPVFLTLNVRCEILWTRRQGEDEIHFGVRYLPLDRPQTEVLMRFFYQNFRLKLWEWPDKRDSPRVSRKLVCHYKDAEGNLQLCMLRDLSVTGLGLVLVGELPVETETSFRFAVAEDLICERTGRVVRCKKMDKGYDVGVLFGEQSESEREEIMKAIARAARFS